MGCQGVVHGVHHEHVKGHDEGMLCVVVIGYAEVAYALGGMPHTLGGMPH